MWNTWEKGYKFRERKSIEEAKKEVELAQKKLELLPRRSVMGCILQLLHRLFHLG